MAWSQGETPDRIPVRGLLAIYPADGRAGPQLPPLLIPDEYKIHQHQATENDEPKTAYYGDDGDGLEDHILVCAGRAPCVDEREQEHCIKVAYEDENRADDDEGDSDERTHR
jgi:hypothetical protein